MSLQDPGEQRRGVVILRSHILHELTPGSRKWDAEPADILPFTTLPWLRQGLGSPGQASGTPETSRWRDQIDICSSEKFRPMDPPLQCKMKQCLVSYQLKGLWGRPTHTHLEHEQKVLWSEVCLV